MNDKSVKSSNKSKAEVKDPHWPCKVPGTDYVLEKDNCLINIHPVRCSFIGTDGSRYRVPPQGLVPKSLFKKWQAIKGLIEFRGNPKGKCVVVPGHSSH